jgi:hypothetical protein
MVMATEFQRISLVDALNEDLTDYVRRSLSPEVFSPDVRRRAVFTRDPGLTRVRREEVIAALIGVGFAKREIEERSAPGEPPAIVVQTRGPKQLLAERGQLDDSWFTGAAVHPDFGQATNHNLAVQMVDKERLDRPLRLGRVNPMAAVGAVERYQKGEVRALGDQNLEAGKAGEN